MPLRSWISLAIAFVLLGCTGQGENPQARIEVQSTGAEIGGFAPEPSERGISIVDETGNVLATGRDAVLVTFNDTSRSIRLSWSASSIVVAVRAYECSWMYGADERGTGYSRSYLDEPGDRETIRFTSRDCPGEVTLRRLT